MRKDNKSEIFEGDKFKVIMYIGGITLAVSIIVFIIVFLFYNKNLDNNAELSLIEMGAVGNTLVPNSISENSTQASITEDKTVGQAQNTIVVEIERKATPAPTPTATPEEKKVEQNTEENSNVEENNDENKTTENVSNENIKLEAPVAGEILTDYADETLVYSKTLDEWTTHFGIDIKANRTTVVKASADGTVESIKNDPRYGLTITISHENGFKTVYSNLLTTEFVSEGEEVKCGQTIATVGETAAFEVSEENHLHFEVLKDNKNVNPTIYLK